MDADTRRASASRGRQYLAGLAGAATDGDPRPAPVARDGAGREYRAHLQRVAKRAPATTNTVLAALAERILSEADVHRPAGRPRRGRPAQRASSHRLRG